MRVTNNMLTTTVLRNLNRNLKRLNTYMEQLSSGKTVNRPSDNPVYVSRIMRLQSMIKNQEKYQQNMEDAQGFVDMSETALGNLSDILNRTRELTVYGANGTLSEEDRETLAAEVDELINEVVEVANSSYEGRYVFGGHKTTKAPFVRIGAITSATVSGSISGVYTLTFRVDGTAVLRDSQNNVVATAVYNNNTAETLVFNVAGSQLSVEKDALDIAGYMFSLEIENSNALASEVAYRGDSGYLEWEVAQGVTMSVNLPGDQVFLRGGVFLALEKVLKALRDNNAQELSGSALQKLDQASEGILSSRAVLGAKSNRLAVSIERASQFSLSLTEILSKIEDVDLAAASMEFSTAENVYRAALFTGTQVLLPTLLDYLG
ncbi:MAG TPA: flagellar hook-associated protein 3 [Peptococcaceae bacterium]|nr:MAG: Flagellar hook-associated protein FlgL [Clostridia bacterium 41_269]HBT20195.1 flagellar hook-associated protein 3 [Peptococcaceae bacterium]